MGKPNEFSKKDEKKKKRKAKWEKYYSKTKKGVDMMAISKNWYQAGREVKNRLDLETDSWCRQQYTQVARDIGHKPSQFPPYQIINGNRLGIRLRDLTYTFGSEGLVTYTLGTLMERCIAMKRAEEERIERRKARAARKKERLARKALAPITGELDEYEDEEEEEDSDSDEELILDLEDWEMEDDDDDDDENPDRDNGPFKRPDCLRDLVV
ncbi:hypothetical protein PRIPAC_95522 [Pristionchus pacificus]|uniref:Uncharacterized protein n=1 Tax=Pristionchus pacificus TaxID=54126 RepID=A0A454XNA2_PRIPA|nr:hypothetical protein PRIPAC_95522 [Pristionchus pacificus]|eukprot:PDM81669.1 hypothetical protein PRIPAC_30650 [Pristionchus pacificus]